MNRGSEWHKWDLHFHTPSSYDYKDKSVTNEDLINGLIANGVEAVAITDHHIIDVDRIQELQRISAGRITILPGIEFLSDTRGEEPIHFIGIFPENINLTHLWEQIKVKTSIDKIYSSGVGPETVYNILTDTCKLIHENGGLVTIHAGSKSCGLEKITNSLPHTMAQKEDIARYVDIFDMGKEKDFDGYRKFVFPCLKKVYPMILCSDNHDIKNYSVKQNCWIKGMTNFAGLKQIIFEPELRVKIQSSNPDNKLGRLVISEAEFEDEDGLFGKQTVYFNENLNSIIGGKSSGKSLLLHSMANAIDAAQVGRISDSLKIPRTYFDGSYRFKVRWKDGYENMLFADNEDNRKITYIPQLYINYLAEKDNEEELNNLLVSILRQNADFASFYTKKKAEIVDGNASLQVLFNDMVSERREAMDAFNSLKETGKVEEINKSIEDLKNRINTITKSSALSPDEQIKYKEHLELEENQQKWVAYYKAMIELKARVLSTVDYGINMILGERIDGESSSTYSKLQSMLAPYQIPEDFRRVVYDYEINQKNLVSGLKSALGQLDYEAKIKECEMRLAKCRADIKPILDKLKYQKDLELLKTKLHAETSRLEKAVVLDKKFRESLANYRELQKKTGEALSQLYAHYKDIVDTVNDSYSNITDEIKLVASLGYKREDSKFYTSVNKNKLTDSSYFFSIYPKDSDMMNIDEVPKFFYSIKSLKDGRLNYSLDGKSIDFLPMNQGYESIEDLFGYLLEDYIKLHFDIQYKNDHLLHMSPGKKEQCCLSYSWN